LSRIRALEEALLDPAIRQSAEQIESLLSGDFFEFGSSGRIYHFNKGDTFPLVYGYEITDFAVTELDPDCALATYKIGLDTIDGVRSLLRSTIWRRFDDQWKAVFHQGTPV